jgi:hypothetical protein
MDRFRDWFGTPAAAVKTLIWLCWVSLLISVLIGLVALVAWAFQAALT